MNEANHLKPEDLFVFERGKPRVRALDSERTDGAEWLHASRQRRIEAEGGLRGGELCYTKTFEKTSYHECDKVVFFDNPDEVTQC